jgi:serine/threonine protein kinase
MNVQKGMNMWIDDRLQIYADIKPQNVLVFKNSTGKTTVKVTDFGYSTLVADKTHLTGKSPAEGQAPAAGQEERVLLPKSRQWNAP